MESGLLESHLNVNLDSPTLFYAHLLHDLDYQGLLVLLYTSPGGFRTVSSSIEYLPLYRPLGSTHSSPVVEDDHPLSPLDEPNELNLINKEQQVPFEDCLLDLEDMDLEPPDTDFEVNSTWRKKGVGNRKPSEGHILIIPLENYIRLSLMGEVHPKRRKTIIVIMTVIEEAI